MKRLTSLVGLVALLDPFAARAESSVPTFARDVSPLLAKHCSECHHAGYYLNLGAFPFVSRGDALDPLRVLETVKDGDMPPAPRDPLSESEINVIASWIEGGAEP